MTHPMNTRLCSNPSQKVRGTKTSVINMLGKMAAIVERRKLKLIKQHSRLYNVESQSALPKRSRDHLETLLESGGAKVRMGTPKRSC